MVPTRSGDLAAGRARAACGRCGAACRDGAGRGRRGGGRRHPEWGQRQSPSSVPSAGRARYSRGNPGPAQAGRAASHARRCSASGSLEQLRRRGRQRCVEPLRGLGALVRGPAGIARRGRTRSRPGASSRRSPSRSGPSPVNLSAPGWSQVVEHERDLERVRGAQHSAEHRRLPREAVHPRSAVRGLGLGETDRRDAEHARRWRAPTTVAAGVASGHSVAVRVRTARPGRPRDDGDVRRSSRRRDSASLASSTWNSVISCSLVPVMRCTPAALPAVTASSGICGSASPSTTGCHVSAAMAGVGVDGCVRLRGEQPLRRQRLQRIDVAGRHVELRDRVLRDRRRRARACSPTRRRRSARSPCGTTRAPTGTRAGCRRCWRRPTRRRSSRGRDRRRTRRCCRAPIRAPRPDRGCRRCPSPRTAVRRGRRGAGSRTDRAGS